MSSRHCLIRGAFKLWNNKARISFRNVKTWVFRSCQDKERMAHLINEIQRDFEQLPQKIQETGGEVDLKFIGENVIENFGFE